MKWLRNAFHRCFRDDLDEMRGEVIGLREDRVASERLASCDVRMNARCTVSRRAHPAYDRSAARPSRPASLASVTLHGGPIRAAWQVLHYASPSRLAP